MKSYGEKPCVGYDVLVIDGYDGHSNWLDDAFKGRCRAFGKGFWGEKEGRMRDVCAFHSPLLCFIPLTFISLLRNLFLFSSTFIHFSIFFYYFIYFLLYL